MSSHRTSSGEPTKELQGPRPPTLKICRESHRIRKSVPAVSAVPSMPIISRSEPVIIHMQSPQVIHAEVQDFMTLVQRLTGRSSSSDTHSCSAKSENLTADQCTVIHEASDATTSSQLAMGSSRIGNRTSDVNPTTSSSITKIDRN